MVSLLFCLSLFVLRLSEFLTLCFILDKTSFILKFFPENEEKLNQEERSFIEDPANSHLFDQQEMGEDEISIVDTHSDQSAKGPKAANNQCEVS